MPKIKKTRKIINKSTGKQSNGKKSTGKMYYTLGQGRKPFLVNINKNNIEIYKQSSNGKHEDLVLKTKFISYPLTGFDSQIRLCG